jgi:hypothetical protein
MEAVTTQIRLPPKKFRNVSAMTDRIDVFVYRLQYVYIRFPAQSSMWLYMHCLRVFYSLQEYELSTTIYRVVTRNMNNRRSNFIAKYRIASFIFLLHFLNRNIIKDGKHSNTKHKFPGSPCTRKPFMARNKCRATKGTSAATIRGKYTPTWIYYTDVSVHQWTANWSNNTTDCKLISLRQLARYN